MTVLPAAGGPCLPEFHTFAWNGRFSFFQLIGASRYFSFCVRLNALSFTHDVLATGGPHALCFDQTRGCETGEVGVKLGSSPTSSSSSQSTVGSLYPGSVVSCKTDPACNFMAVFALRSPPIAGVAAAPLDTVGAF